MKIQIISVGEPKKHYYKEAIEEQLKRLGTYAVTYHAVKDNKHSYDKIHALVEKSYVVAMDEGGKQMASRQLARFLEDIEMRGEGQMSIVIGPADGHPAAFVQDADYVLALSKLTLPHEMALLFTTEAIYRALSIRNNHPYHRD